MSRENRRKAAGIALVLIGLLAGPGAARAWDLPLSGLRSQSTEVIRLWREAWSNVEAIWSATTSAADPGSNTSPAPSSQGGGNSAEHSPGIDPNG